MRTTDKKRDGELQTTSRLCLINAVTLIVRVHQKRVSCYCHCSSSSSSSKTANENGVTIISDSIPRAHMIRRCRAQAKKYRGKWQCQRQRHTRSIKIMLSDAIIRLEICMKSVCAMHELHCAMSIMAFIL